MTVVAPKRKRLSSPIILVEEAHGFLRALRVAGLDPSLERAHDIYWFVVPAKLVGAGDAMMVGWKAMKEYEFDQRRAQHHQHVNYTERQVEITRRSMATVGLSAPEKALLEAASEPNGVDPVEHPTGVGLAMEAVRYVRNEEGRFYVTLDGRGALKGEF